MAADDDGVGITGVVQRRGRTEGSAGDRRRTRDRRRISRTLVEDGRGSAGEDAATLDEGHAGTVGAALEAATSTMTARSLVAVALVSLVGLVVGSAVLLLGPDRTSDSLTVNVAGRQRMLSQRIAGAAQSTLSGDEAAADRLVRAVEEFRLAHHALRSGDGTLAVTRRPDPALVDAYARPGGVDDQVRAFTEDVDVVVAGGQDRTGSVAPDVARTRVAAAVDRIVAAAAGPLLDALDEAVAIDQRAAEGRAATASLLGRLALGALVVVLAVAGRAVLRPLAAELRRSALVVRATEREAERRAEWHSRFAGIAAHELRTPVTIVAGLAETLSAHWDELDEQLVRDVVARIARQGAHMKDLVEELSLVAGLAAAPLDDQPWQLAEIVDSLVDSHGIVVEVAAHRSVRVDARRLDLVLRELVDNAQRHGVLPVEAAVEVTDGDVVVGVTDAGPGVPDDAVEHLLRPFTTATDVVHHSSSDGTGIGLALVAGIAAEVGGSVTQETGPDGCTWRVTFPGMACRD